MNYLCTNKNNIYSLWFLWVVCGDDYESECSESDCSESNYDSYESDDCAYEMEQLSLSRESKSKPRIFDCQNKNEFKKANKSAKTKLTDLQLDTAWEAIKKNKNKDIKMWDQLGVSASIVEKLKQQYRLRD